VDLEKKQETNWSEEILKRRGKISYSIPQTKNMVGISSLYKTGDRFSVSSDQIRTALNNNDVIALRKMSKYFWLVSGEYRRLVSYYAGIMTNQILAIPNASSEEMQRPKFKKEYNAILDYIESSSVEETCTQIQEYMVKDGAFFGVERDLNGQFTVQSLPGDYCRSRFKILGMYALEFDFSFFNSFIGDAREEMFSAFPKEFKTMYAKYQKDQQNERWQLIDPNAARVHIFDEGSPMLASVFLELLELAEYKAIDKIKSRLGITKILINELPSDDDGIPTLLQEEAVELHKNVYNMITNPGQTIDVISTPTKITSIDLMDKTPVAMNDIEKATNMIYTTAGTPMILFNAGAKSSSVGLKLSVQGDEALMAPVLKQFEKWYTNRFSTIASSFTFRAKFLEISRFNRKEMLELYLLSGAAGFPVKLATMAALGFGQREAANLISLENDFLKFPEIMKPNVSSHVQSGNENQNKEKSELTEEGQATKDGDKNDNRS